MTPVEKILERLTAAEEALVAAEAAIGPARRKYAAAALTGMKKVLEEARTEEVRASDLVDGLRELLAEAKHAELGSSIDAFAQERATLNTRLYDLAEQKAVLEERFRFMPPIDSPEEATLKRLKVELHAGETERTNLDALIAEANQCRSEIEEAHPFVKAAA